MSTPRKTMPPAIVEPQDTHFSINFAVRVGGTSIAYCDEALRAALVCEAVNSWRRTAAGKKWWKQQVNGSTYKE